MNPRMLAALLLAVLTLVPATAQNHAAATSDDKAKLQFVLYISRHGVRSPTGKSAQYDQYSTAPWPTWNVPPGYLTAHGFQLMQIFGAYDRQLLESQHLFSSEPCAPIGSVTVYADSDQRTRETGKALAAGLFPGCNLPVHSLDEGVNDPLFHLPESSIKPADSALATAAIAGRIGANPQALTEAYHAQLAELDNILATCGGSEAKPHKRTSILDVPASLTPGARDHVADLRGPLNTASTLTENILLEYTEGLEDAKVGWGCVDGSKLRSLIDLHTAASDLAQRTPAIARMQSANLLHAIEASLEQAVTHQAVAGAPGQPSDHALFLIGHDTNLSNLAGALNLNWLLDGRRDDTPPGSTLIFELWQSAETKAYSVRVYFSAQTLEQMRSATALTLSNPPPRVPVFLPGCSRSDFSCSWADFASALNALQHR
jgi:4-phytase/acid phosphatase